MKSGWTVNKLISWEVVGFFVDYIPLNQEVSDLHHLTFKRYYDGREYPAICGIGFRTYPSPRQHKELPFPTKQSGIVLLSSEEDLDYTYGDAWEGVVIRNPISYSQLRILTIEGNNYLSKLEKGLTSNA